MANKPVIAVTMGDPAGIGPELVVKVLSDPSVWDICRPVVIADPAVMAENVRRLGAGMRFRQIAGVAEARFAPPEVDLLCPPGVRVESIAWGTVDAAMGKAATLCMREAYLLGMRNEVQGVACAPLNKQAFHMAGYDYFDEVAFLVDLTHSKEAYILGVTDTFWTVAMAEHVTFTRIAGLVTKDRILSRTRSLNDCLRRGGWAKPRLAVAALNVHAGEGGLFGREEIDEIEPAIEQARREGLNVQGPVPADAVFVRRARASLTAWCACTTTRPTSPASCSRHGEAPASTWACLLSAAPQRTAPLLTKPGRALPRPAA